MRISELYERAGNHDRARKYKGKAADIDVHAWLCKQSAEYEKSLHGGIRERHTAILRERAYSRADISVPLMDGFSIDYQDGNTYLADLVCPVVDTSGNVKRTFGKWSRRDARRMVDAAMSSSKSTPNETNIDFSTDSYTEKPYGLIQKIANSDIADAPDVPGLVAAHARSLMGDMKRQREKRVFDLIFTSGNYASGCTSALTSTNRWDVLPSTSTADPLKDIRLVAGTAVGLARRFNTMVLGVVAWEYLRTHPKVIAAAGAKSSDRVLDEGDIAKLFGLKNIWISDAKKDTAGNSGTSSEAYLAPKHVALLYVQPGAQMNELSFCKTFRHHAMRYEDIDERLPGINGVTVLKLTHADAEKVVASDAGYLLTDVVS